MDPLLFKSASELIKLILRGEVTSINLMQAILTQIDLHNPRINAITDLRSREDLIREAQEKDDMIAGGKISGPLHGLPMTVKDSFNVQGLISSLGDPSLSKNIASEDAFLVKKLKDAGAIIIGKTNLPLFSIDWQSKNSWFGQTNNPYQTEYVAGGSSGGAAAALAMGFTPLELGSDAGGSIRVPAHFCGICGLRPTEHRLSNKGQFLFPGKPQGHRHVTVPGPMARTVEDLLLMMSVLTTPTEASEIPPVDFHNSHWDKTPLKIAYSDSLQGIEIERDYKELIHAFFQSVASQGHACFQSQPEHDEELAYALNGRFMGFEIASASPMPRVLTAPLMFLFILFKYRDIQWAKNTFKGIMISPRRYQEALEAKEIIAEAYERFFKDCDIWLTPVASLTAFKHQRAGKPFKINGKIIKYTDALGRFNFGTALGGHPVVVIPIGQTKKGLPAGIAIHGPKWQDKKLLQIAKELQEKCTFGFQKPGT